MAITDAAGLPVSAHVESASPHEVKLVEATIDSGFTRYAPDKLVGDKAYDSDRLDEQLLHERGVEIIAPHPEDAKRRLPKMAESLGAISVAGKSNACLPGCKIFDELLFDMNTMLRISSVWFISVAL